MKKIFLLSLVAVFALSLNAQTYTNLKAKKAPSQVNTTIDTEVGGTLTIPQRDPGFALLGTAPNIYGIMLAGPHQLMYNSDINTVIAVHRQNGQAASGALGFDYSTDGGITWTNDILISEPTSLCRYPSATIYNPEGNTDPANAKVVANGPLLVDGASWGYTFEIDATLSATPTTNSFYGSNTGTNEDFHPYGLEMGPDGTAWSASINYNPTTEEYIGDIFINKAEWNGTKMEWTSPLHTISPDYYIPAGEDKLFNGWDVAVDPLDGDHVYAVVNCCVIGDTKDIPSPHVWETTDGGTTWTEVVALDFTAEPFATELDNYIIYNEGEEMKPYVVDVDATVDANGALHIMTTTYSGAADWGYIYGAFADDGTPSQHYIDYMWNGTEWSMIYIKSLECEDATWADVTISAHPEISRTEDGQNIIYSWSQTYQDADSLNTAPNIWAKTWNISGNETEPLDLTTGTGAAGICYFPQFSPVCIDNGATIEIPMMIAAIDYASGTDLDPAMNLYLSGYEVDKAAANVNATVTKPAVTIYPNPVADILYVSTGANVELCDITGKVIVSVNNQDEVKQIQMSNYPAGTYIVKAYTNKGVVSKKVINIK